MPRPSFTVKQLAILLCTLFVLASLVVPNSIIGKIDFLGVGGGLGMGTAQAADIGANSVDETSTTATSVNYPNQRATFYTKSRFWAFYSDGTDLLVKSSLTGTSWSSATTILAGVSAGEKFSVWLSSEGDNVSIAYAPGVANNALQYANYSVYDNGTISTTNGWQTAVAADAAKTYSYPYVCQDSNSKPVISYQLDNGVTTTPYCTRSSAADGTWVADFDTQLSSTDGTWLTTVLPYGANLMAIYSKDAQTIKSKVYSGSWGTENATASAVRMWHSAVATSDNVIHLAFNKDTDYDLTFTSYNGSAWGTEYVAYNGTSQAMAPALSRTIDDNFYIFWLGDNVSNHVFYTSSTDDGATWATKTDWLTEANVCANYTISSAYTQTTANYIPVVWMIGAGSPYSVRFAAVERSLEPWLTGYEEMQALNLSAASASPITQSWTTDGTYYWTCPVGVAQLSVQCWGGGGGGGYSFAANTGGGGGGGGAYAYNGTVTVTPNTTYTIVVGAGGRGNPLEGGGQSYFDNATVVAANGGSAGGVPAGGSPGGAGGTVAAGSGYAGGAGGDGGASLSGGGGEGGCTTGVGNAGTSALPGLGGSGCDGGDGGNGGSGPANGLPGSTPGGGGGAGYKVGTTRYGGAGADGQVSITYTPSVLDDKVSINVYKGSKTVEDCNITIDTGADNRTFNYCVSFGIQTFDALTADTYPIRVVIDTQTLVEGGFFAGSSADNASTVEFAEPDGSNPMPYWVPETTTGGVSSPKYFNTTGTIYYITPQTSLSANTTYTYCLFVDPDVGSASPNYDPEEMVGAGGFFEHFDTTADNLSDFESKYAGIWYQDPDGNDPSIIVTGSVLTLDGVDNVQYEGIASVANMTDFRALFGLQTWPGSNAYIGVFDDNGVEGPGQDGMIHKGTADQEWTYYYNGAADTTWDFSVWPSSATLPYVVEMSKYQTRYKYGALRDEPGGAPDTFGLGDELPEGGYIAHLLTANVTNKIIIGSLSLNDIDVDWVAMFNEIRYAPFVGFPDITYDQIGTVFINDDLSSSYSDTAYWWYELAFTDPSNTEIYWCVDELAQLTRNPGDSIRVIVNVGSAVTANTSVNVYYDYPTASGLPSYCDASHVYGDSSSESYRWQSMNDETDWTERAGGNWTANTTTAEPVIYKAPVGNVGGASGRTRQRLTTPVKWTDGYYWIGSLCQWELSGYRWPMGYNAHVQHSDTLESIPEVGYMLISPQWRYQAMGAWPYQAITDNADAPTKLYVTWNCASSTGGFYVSWTEDPSDPDSWQHNMNGPFLDATWVNAHTGGDFAGVTNTLCGNIIKWEGTWYATIVATTGDPGKASCAYTTDDPEDWTTSSFTYIGDLMIDSDQTGGKYLEDDHFAYDDANNTWYWTMFLLDAENQQVYFTLDEDTYDFPGEAALANKWSASPAGFNFTESPMRAEYRSARLTEDDSGDWILTQSCQGLIEVGSYATRWIPNHVYAWKCTDTPADNFTSLNTDAKYYQSDGAGLDISHVTDSNKANGTITCQIILPTGETSGQAGIIFRFDNATVDCLFASVDYNAGDPKVKLESITGGGAPVAIAAAYDIPQFPTPWLTLGIACQLKVDFYSDNLQVSLSLNGAEWNTCFNESDTTYMSAGHYGLATYNAAAYFDNFAFTDLSSTSVELITAGEPTLSITVIPDSLTSFYKEGTGSATSYLRADTWYTSENLSGNPSSGTSLFTLTNNGGYTVDVSISSSENWTGVGKTWTVSPTGTPGDSTIGIWAGLDSDSSYPTLVKPDAPANLLIIGLGSGEHDHFGLLFYTPTSNIGNVQMEGWILLTAMVHT